VIGSETPLIAMGGSLAVAGVSPARQQVPD
jgi:hypothetical protein